MIPTSTRAKTPALIDARLVEALRDQTRGLILNALTQRAASATEIAREIGVEPSKLRYHFDKLLKLGCIEEVFTKQKRGGTERFYRATVRHYFDADVWKDVPEGDRLPAVMGVLGLISHDIGESIQAGTITADDVYLARTPMKLDGQGWLELAELFDGILDDLLSIRERAAVRLADSGEKPRMAKVTMIQVETPKDETVT